MRAVYINGKLVAPELLHTHCRGSMAIVPPASTTLTTAGQWYKITGTYTDGLLSCFTLNTNGRLTYVGESGVVAIFAGSSNLTADKACTITYGLYKKGSLVTPAQSPVGVSNPGKDVTNAITKHIELTNGDYFEIWAKSDTANTELTVNALSITIDGHS